MARGGLKTERLLNVFFFFFGGDGVEVVSVFFFSVCR